MAIVGSINYVLKINDVAQNLEYGFKTVKIVQETLDNGELIIISDKKDSFEPFSSIDIIKSQLVDAGEPEEQTITIEENYLIDHDYPNNLGVSGLYKHRLGIIELTKKLEAFIVGSLGIQQPRIGGVAVDDITVLETVERVVAYCEYYEGFTMTLSARLITLLSAGNTRMPQKKWQNKNVREMLNDIFRVKDALPRLLKNNVLDYDSFNEKNNLIVRKNVFSSNSKRDTSEYLSRFRSFVINAKNNKDVAAGGFYYPNDVDYVTPRAPKGKQGKFITSEAVWHLAEGMPMNESLSIKLIVPTDTAGDLEFEIGDLVLLKADRDLLPLGSNALPILVQSRSQANTLYYELNGGELKGMGETWGILSNLTTISMVSYTKLYEHSLTNPGFDWQAELDTPSMQDWKLRIFYTPEKNYAIEIVKSKIKYNNYEATKLINQPSSTVEIESYGDFLISFANRTGNPEIIEGVEVLRLDELIEVKDYLDTGEVIYVIEAFHYKTMIIQKPYLLDEFNRLQQQTAIENAKRDYNVSPTIKTNRVKRAFIEVSQVFREDSVEIIRDLAMLTFLNIFDYDVSRDRPVNSFTYFFADIDPITSVIKGSCLSIGQGNTLSFNWGFETANVAGFQLLVEDGTFYNKAVKYTGPVGRQDESFISFLPADIPNNVLPSAYPLVSPPAGGDVMFKLDNYVMLKNSSEITDDTVSIHVVSDVDSNNKNDFIIGARFINDNNLVKLLSVVQNLGVYESDEPYGELDRFEVKGTLNPALEIIVDFTFFNIAIIGVPTKNWAIGDSNGNLLLAATYIIPESYPIIINFNRPDPTLPRRGLNNL